MHYHNHGCERATIMLIVNMTNTTMEIDGKMPVKGENGKRMSKGRGVVTE
jgi:hypothetical protein